MKEYFKMRDRDDLAALAEQPKTLSVPEAGRRYFGLSQASSYKAAKDGMLPTIRIGRILRVSVPALERMLAEAKPRSVA